MKLPGPRRLNLWLTCSLCATLAVAGLAAARAPGVGAGAQAADHEIRVDATLVSEPYRDILDEIDGSKMYAIFGPPSGAVERQQRGWMSALLPWITWVRIAAALGGSYGPTIAADCDHARTTGSHRVEHPWECGHDGTPGYAAQCEILKRRPNGTSYLDFTFFDDCLKRLLDSGLLPHLDIPSANEQFTGGGSYDDDHRNTRAVTEHAAWREYVRQVFAHLKPFGMQRWRFSCIDEPDGDGGGSTRASYRGDENSYAATFAETVLTATAIEPEVRFQVGSFAALPSVVPPRNGLDAYLSTLRLAMAEVHLPFDRLGFVSVDLRETPDLVLGAALRTRLISLWRDVDRAELPRLPLKIDELDLDARLRAPYDQAHDVPLDSTLFAASWQAKAVKALQDNGAVSASCPWSSLGAWGEEAWRPYPRYYVCAFFPLLSGRIAVVSEGETGAFRALDPGGADPLWRALAVDGELLAARGDTKPVADDRSLEVFATREDGSGRIRLLVLHHDRSIVSDADLAARPDPLTARVTVAGLKHDDYRVRAYVVAADDSIGTPIRWDPDRKRTTPFVATDLGVQHASPRGELTLAGRSGERLSIPSHGVILFELTPQAPRAAPGKRPLQFRDVSKEAGLDRVTVTYTAAAGDYDRDGYPDLMISNHEKSPSLHHNQRDGTFEDQSSIGGFEKGDIHGITWVDFDDDGWLDLVLSIGAGRGRGQGAKRVYLNREGQRFERIDPGELFRNENGRGRFICPVDFDHDGKLDYVFMNHYQEGRGQLILVRRGTSFEDRAERAHFATIAAGNLNVIHAAEDGEPIYIVSSGGKDAGTVLQPAAGGEMRDVSKSLGIQPHWSVNAVAAGDYDDDGDLDLFFARGPSLEQKVEVIGRAVFFVFNASPPKQVKGFRFRAQGKVRADILFEGTPQPKWLKIGGGRLDVTRPVWEADASDPSLAGDPAIDPARDLGGFLWRDQDGTLVYQYCGDEASVGESSGSIRADVAPVLVSVLRDPGRPDSSDVLYANRDGKFVDVTGEAGVGDRGSGQDAVFGDFDNDGYLDLFIVNGGAPFHNQPDALYQNAGNGRFAEVTDAAGAAGPATGRGCSVLAFDYDQDGDLDLFLTNGRGPPPRNEGPYTLLRNETQAGRSFTVDLASPDANRFAVGARVTVRCGDRVQRQERCAATGIYSASVLPMPFGMDLADQASVEVLWPSGRRSTASARPGDRLVLTEPTGVPSPSPSSRPAWWRRPAPIAAGGALLGAVLLIGWRTRRR